MRKLRKKSKYENKFRYLIFPKMKRIRRKVKRLPRSKKLRGFKRLCNKYYGNDVIYGNLVRINSKYLRGLSLTIYLVSEISYADESILGMKITDQSPLWIETIYDLEDELELLQSKIKELNEYLIVESIVKSGNASLFTSLLNDNDRYIEVLKSHIPDIPNHYEIRKLIFDLDGVEPYLVSALFIKEDGKKDSFEVGMEVFKRYMNGNENVMSIVHEIFNESKSNFLKDN